MHFVVLGSPTSWYLNDLRRAAGNRQTIETATFRDLTSSIDPASIQVGSGEIALGEADAVIVRTMPPGSLEQVVLRMDALAQLEAAGVPVMNPPKAMEVAIDKYLATARLQQAGLLVPRTIACQTAQAGIEAFRSLGGRAVMKPLFGGEGRGVTLLTDEAMAQRAFALLEQLGGVIYLQEFIEHEGYDLRLLVIGEKVLGMRRANPTDWRTNISRGAKAESLEVTADLAEIAQAAATAIGAPLAGVDLLPARDGQLYAIEVNAVPGWRALSRITGTDVAALVLEYCEADAVRG